MPDRANVIVHEETERGRPMGEILRDILEDVGSITRAEFRLARIELAGKARQTGKAAGPLAAAAIAWFLAAACFVTACIGALTLVMGLWLAALLMGILPALIAAGAYVSGRIKLSEIDFAPVETVQTLTRPLKRSLRS
jgi:fatty acid desaturase